MVLRFSISAWLSQKWEPLHPLVFRKSYFPHWPMTNGNHKLRKLIDLQHLAVRCRRASPKVLKLPLQSKNAASKTNKTNDHDLALKMVYTPMAIYLKGKIWEDEVLIHWNDTGYLICRQTHLYSSCLSVHICMDGSCGPTDVANHVKSNTPTLTIYRTRLLLFCNRRLRNRLYFPKAALFRWSPQGYHMSCRAGSVD